jgi:hypothetical protein
MVQVIQIKRKTTGAGVPATLAPGELAYNTTGHTLVIGDGASTVQNLVSSARQVEMTGDQPGITGAKAFAAGVGNTLTVPIAGLKVPGGNAGEVLVATDALGNMAYSPLVSPIQQFIGSIDAAAGTVQITADAGGGTALPGAAASNGMYLITDVAGAVPPAGAPAGQYEIGDWLISNGVTWTHLFFGGISSVTAADVGVVAPVTGGTNVQEVLEAMQATDATFVVGPALSVLDNLASYADATGHLIKDSGTKITDLATTTYVDSENTAQDTAQAAVDAAQDLIIAANAAFVAAQPAIDLAQDTAINNKITKPAAVLAIGNIATYADLTGGVALDGGRTIAQLDAAIAARGDVVGPATAVADNIAVYDLTTGKLIKDGGTTIAALTAAVGDVKGQTAAIATADNIAVYTGTNSKAIKDGARTLGQIDAAIAARGDVFSTAPIAVALNLAAFSDVGGKMIVDSGQSISSIQTYIDTSIAAIPAATPPLVTSPELTGNGVLGTPITFTGITTDPVVGTGAAGATFTGKGLSTDPLVLAVVDGGTYV